MGDGAHSSKAEIRLDVRLVRTMVEAIWTHELESDVLRWVPGFDSFGYARDELGDTSAWVRERIHPDDRGRASKRHDEALAGDAQSWCLEYRFRRRDGSWADVLTPAIIDRDARGKAVRVSGMMIDLTRRKETERALGWAQQMLLEAHRVGQLNAWEEDLSNGTVVTDLAILVGERRLQEVPSAEVWARIHADDVERAQTLRREAIASGSSFETELRVQREHEEQRTMLVRGRLVRDVEGRPDRLVGTAFDITERKHAEDDARATQRLLRLVLDTLPVAVQVMDRDGNILLWNEVALRRIWGDVIPTPAERYERSIGYWHHTGERIAREEWGSQRALKHGETSTNQLFDIDSYDGRRRVIKNSAAPLRDDKGEIVGAVVVNEDVTEAVHAREELERRERQQTALAQLGLFALDSDSTQTLFDEAASLVSRTLDVDDVRVTVPTPPGVIAGGENVIAVPIAGKSQAFGVLEARSSTKRTFTQDEIQFVRSAANMLASCIARQQSADELRDKREELQALSRKLIEVQEAERRAVARELHDDFGQVLTALRMNLQRKAPDEKENIELVDGAIARMRDLVQDLRPPQLDELGLEESLRWYVQQEARRAGLDVTIDVDGQGIEPPPVVATTAFRVIQEALTNVVRHAGAQTVTATLRRADEHLEVVVKDDGKGFVVADARKRAARGESYGLLGMQERVELVGGELEIDSMIGRGTSIRARLPLPTRGAS